MAFGAPPKLPATVSADLMAIASECTGVGGKAQTLDAVKLADLNGDGAGAARTAFSALVYGAKLEGTGPAGRLWLTVSGQECGRKPAADFASESFCERYIQWNAKTQKFDFAPVATVKMIQ